MPDDRPYAAGGDDADAAPSDFDHVPVLRDRIVELLAAVPPGLVVDATVGGGGHTAALLGVNASITVLGLDRDPDALDAAASAVPSGLTGRLELVHTTFDRLGQVLDDRGVERVSGVLFDLGVSSPQLDRPERGFSYRNDGPLDMRMDPSASLSAADVVNGYPQRELAAVIERYGDERFASRIAAAIVAARPVTSTAALAEIVRGAIPAATRRHGGHPAKRTFQALRIETNDELGMLERALATSVDRLVPRGRCVVASYHSGEDRIVKRCFVDASTGGCECPPGLPCGCGAQPTVRLVRRGAWKASQEEIADNPRAASVRLRAVERLDEAAGRTDLEHRGAL